MFAVAPTDSEWFYFLRDEVRGGVVNFWTPTPWNISGLSVGSPFYFCLKSPVRKICGRGIFARYVNLPLRDAWSQYGKANGVPYFGILNDKISGYIGKNAKRKGTGPQAKIGCIELTGTIFLDDNDFVSLEDCGVDFKPQVVKLKYYQGDNVNLDLKFGGRPRANFKLVEGKSCRRGGRSVYREGQSEFHTLILNNYGGRCCVTGEPVQELLHAAHIQPYMGVESNHAQNGLCLRIDVHKLFDEGLLSVDSSYIIRVSPRLRNTHYEQLDGHKIRLPNNEADYPSKEALKFQRSNLR